MLFGAFAAALVLGPGFAPFALGRRVFHISAGTLVVAAPVLLADYLVIGIDVGGEAVLAPAIGAGQARCLSPVFEKVVFVAHISPPHL